MTTHANDDVNARLDRLERDLRRWRRAAVVAGGVLGLVALVGATTPKAAPIADEVRARQFVLVDEEGSVRGRLHLIGSMPYLAFYDIRDDRQAVGLSQTGLYFTPAKGRPQLAKPFVSFVDDDGSASLSSNALVVRGREPSVVLSDENGQARVTLGAVAVLDKKTGAVGHMHPSSLALFDKDGKILFGAP